MDNEYWTAGTPSIRERDAQGARAPQGPGDAGHRADTPVGRPQTSAPRRAAAGAATAAARLRWLAGGWALLYAVYRGYYALGGTAGMFGMPVSLRQWQLINAVGAVFILLAAVLPVTTARLWHSPRARGALLTVGWVIAVGCVMHGLVDIATRLLSIAGVIHMQFPFFVAGSFDRRAADVQDLFFNEPWFLIEGLLWAALCWVELTVPTSARVRHWWLASALAAIAMLTAIGVLSAAGIIGRMIIM